MKRKWWSRGTSFMHLRALALVRVLVILDEGDEYSTICGYLSFNSNVVLRANNSFLGVCMEIIVFYNFSGTPQAGCSHPLHTRQVKFKCLPPTLAPVRCQTLGQYFADTLVWKTRTRQRPLHGWQGNWNKGNKGKKGQQGSKEDNVHVYFTDPIKLGFRMKEHNESIHHHQRHHHPSTLNRIELN